MVTHWHKNGRIALTDDGRVDVKASDGMLGASIDPARGGGVGRASKGREKQEAPSSSYTEVRTEREKFTLKSQEVEYRKAVGELVERSEFARGMTANIGPTVGRIRTISARLAARLAAEPDVRKVTDMLDDEVEAIQQEVADYAQALIDSVGKKRQ